MARERRRVNEIRKYLIHGGKSGTTKQLGATNLKLLLEVHRRLKHKCSMLMLVLGHTRSHPVQLIEVIKISWLEMRVKAPQ